MAIKKIRIKGRAFEYDDDRSWDKWKKYVVNWQNTEFDRLNWIMKNVVITDPKTIVWSDAIQLKLKLEDKFGLTQSKIKKLLKDTGKVARGVTIKYLSYRAMEYQILMGMGGAVVKNIADMSIHDIFFYKKMLDEKFKQEQDAIKEQERKAKALASKNRRR